ncbi:primosomal protein N' [Mycobacterium sp. URHB0021]
MPIDPTADRARRAWLECPNCRHGAGCSDCQLPRNCSEHWQYLLSNNAAVVHLQCPGCAHLWSVDTHGRERQGRRQRRAA